MENYLINKEDIKTCNEHGVVACWSAKYDKPVVVKSNETDALFSDREVVEIPEAEGSK